jgi:hypothetical protein
VNLLPLILLNPPELRVCSSYCESMYDSCKNLPVGGGTAKQVYGSANNFCTGFLAPMVSNYQLNIYDGELECFNSATRSGQSIALLGFISIVTFVLLQLLY